MNLEENNSVQSPLVFQFKGLIETFYKAWGQEPLIMLTVD